MLPKEKSKFQVPKKDNPSSIDSSKVFETPPTEVQIITVQEKEAEKEATDPAHKNISVEAAGHATSTKNDDLITHNQTCDETLQIVPFEPLLRTSSSDQQLFNADQIDLAVQLTYDPPLRVNSSDQQHVLALAQHGSVQQHVLEPINETESSQQMQQALLNPKVQHELALVEHLVGEGKDADVPFTPDITKCQRKKITKAACYLTRSRGPAPSPPQ